ncbi:hypothetical protein FC692_13770 [Bacillus cereus]|uniref:hypothetical protein n=1 Tax=Bacillus cereus TaxID=1396 RepID=UPI0010BF4923|nr:hypothetical protein [Bacillus cereus]TKH28173.1 hypothetical protein FC692_13770 [Bacillus cereus]
MKKFGIILVMSSLLVGCSEMEIPFESDVVKAEEPIKKEEVLKSRFDIVEQLTNIKGAKTLDEFMILKDSKTQCKYIYTYGSRSLDSGGTSVTPILKPDGKPDCD